MIKKARWLLLLLLLMFPSQELLAAAPKISAKSAVLIDGKTGEVIYEKSGYERRAPASTTKILTAILAIESARTEDIVKVSSLAAATGEATIGLSTGEELTLGELIHGALIKSGNDACVAIAEAIAPSVDEFVGLMNLKAKALGALQSTFVNTNGLPNANHFSSAYDLALIARHALQNSFFSEIVQKKYYTLNWEEPRRQKRIKNTNRLLWDYPQATGVKTGTTNQAGKCLVASARQGEREVIAVVLNTTDRFGDAQKLLDYGLATKY